MAVDALNFVEYDEYLERMEDDTVFSSILEPTRRYVRDIEDPMEYYTNVQFKKRYRFEKETVLAMMKDLHITERLQRFSRQGLPLPPLIQFVCALRIYASGSFQTVLGDLRKIHQSTVSRCLHQVTRIIAEQLGDFVCFPEDNMVAILDVTGFPRAAGILASTRVPLLNPGGVRGEEFRDATGRFSLQVQLVCGARGEVCDLVARWPGGAPDALVYAHSGVRRKMAAGVLSGVLVGDGAYPAGKRLMTPAPDDAHTRYAHAHARAIALGRDCVARLKRRLLCLGRGLAYAPERAGAIVCACVVLHNVAVAMGDEAPDDETDDDEAETTSRPVERSSRGEVAREAFIARHFR